MLGTELSIYLALLVIGHAGYITPEGVSCLA